MTTRLSISALPFVPTPLRPDPLFRTDYTRLTAGPSEVGRVWQQAQISNNPGAAGALQPSRIQVVPVSEVPGAPDDPYKPAGAALRFELRPYNANGANSDGDVTVLGGATTSRAEVLARQAADQSKPAEVWPDPPGSERWYAWSLYMPPDFATATAADWWLGAQWKQTETGSPPIAIRLTGETLEIYGPPAYSLGNITKGAWTQLVIGVRLDPDPAKGWVNVYRNGAQVLPRTALATMKYRADGVTPDPSYFKQGIYRNTTWNATHVVHLGPTTIGRSLAEVLNA